jgi:Cof subfamily protein (haloacid dehalogenase superfamily)
VTKPIRLIATDLDGTLLRSDQTVSQRTRDAIASAQDAGLVIVIATARHPLTARAFAEQAGITGLAICTNGALIYDLGLREIVSETSLPEATAAKVIELLRVEIPGICFAILRAMDFACEPAYAALDGIKDHGRSPEEVVQADALELLALPISKLIVRHPEIGPAEIHRRLGALGVNGCEYSISGAPFLDVVAAGVSKAAGLATICRDLGIPRDEVAAFGDAPNDLPMLRWAGRPVAVANAYPDVLAEIEDRTASNNDDGVAIAIERLLAERSEVTAPASCDNGAP